MGWMDGEIVLVTGGGSGLGAAVAKRCLDEGARVAVLEIMADKADRIRAQYGDTVLVVRGDATSTVDLERCRAEIMSNYGALTGLIAVHGIWDGNTHLVDFSPGQLETSFDEIFNVNVKSYILCAQVFAPLLAASNGTITLTLSNAAFSADGGGVLYTASKHALVGVVRQLAFELAPQVRVNGIAPNGIKGSDLRGPKSLGLDSTSQGDRPAEEFEESVKRLVPLERLSRAEDYTSLYVTIASRQHSSVMTGEVLLADQGMAVRGLYPRPAN